MNNSPKHVAIIMDGNGRWAKSRGHSRIFGHIRGARVAKEIIEAAALMDMDYLTLFAFSTENWLRPIEEVSLLMKLLIKRLTKEKLNLMKNNIRFNCIGDQSRLPIEVRRVVDKTIDETSMNTGLQLIFALSYGGRQEIQNAVQKIALQVQAGQLQPDDISETLIGKNLESSFMPDPDLIIRTSGESRISNFFLWQAAYSEFYVCEKSWPDFTPLELKSAIEQYQQKERRFGMTGEQIKTSDRKNISQSSTSHTLS